MTIALPLYAMGQFLERQIPVYVVARPQLPVFAVVESLQVTGKINNGLKEEIRISAYSFSPS